MQSLRRRRYKDTRVPSARLMIAPLAVAVWATGVGRPAQAGTSIDLEPPASSHSGSLPGAWLSGTGASRSFIFEDTVAFDLSCVGIQFNPSTTTTTMTTLTAKLYSVSGDTFGAAIASDSTVIDDLGRGFYDVPLFYSFAGDSSRYALELSWDQRPEEAIYYDFEGFGDGSASNDPPYEAGPFRVLDGRSGDPGEGLDNFLLAHFRAEVDVVPTPAAALAAVPPLAALAMRRRRRV